MEEVHSSHFTIFLPNCYASNFSFASHLVLLLYLGQRIMLVKPVSKVPSRFFFIISNCSRSLLHPSSEELPKASTSCEGSE